MSAAATAPVRHARFDSMEPSELDYDWAAAIARTLCSRLPDAFDAADLEQIARVACWECSKRYDASRGVHFRRFAYDYVTGAVLMAVRRRAWTDATQAVDISALNNESVPPNQETDIEAQKRDAELYRAISVLPLRERAVIAASAIMDVPMRLVAIRLRISLSLAYVLRQRGLDLLRKRLDPARDPIQDAWPVNGLER